MRSLRRVVFVAVLLSLGCMVALAHMKVSKTAPEDGSTLAEAPAAVQLWFTQEPDLAVSKITLKVSGKDSALDVRAGTDRSLVADVETPLGAGDYVVSWQTAGDDGHIQKGEYRFTVKAAE